MIGQSGYVGSATSWNGTEASSWFDPDKNSEDDIFSFPLYYKTRSVWDKYYWLGRLANGSQIQSGVYKYVTPTDGLVSRSLSYHPDYC